MEGILSHTNHPTASTLNILQKDPGNPLWRWVMKMYEFFGKNPK
jgi:hypothetical protein